jgi:uncharacterized protein YaaR (DUF327 family)
LAKVDTDVQSFYMNPSAYTHVKDEGKKSKVSRTGLPHGDKTGFSRILDEIRGRTAGDIGPLHELPVSEETVNLLIDEVRSTGDTLRDRPFPDEILRYKQAVRNFMHYIVENAYSKTTEAGIPGFLKPGFKGQRGTLESRKQIAYTKIQVIDAKLEELAKRLLTSQMPQMEIASRLEEIKGLLIDLMQ